MDQHFDSLAGFVDWLVGLELDHDRTDTVHWFRGHPHRDLELRPGALRSPTNRRSPLPQNADADRERECHERAINQQFRREAASLLTDRVDPVELYFLAQHHGLPTRLLDWTTHGLAALFFTAVERPDDDGEVIVTSPTWRLTTMEAEDPRAAVLHDAPFPQNHPLVTETVEYLFGDGQRLS